MGRGRAALKLRAVILAALLAVLVLLLLSSIAAHSPLALFAFTVAAVLVIGLELHDSARCIQRARRRHHHVRR
jgi:hypothetical protein